MCVCVCEQAGGVMIRFPLVKGVINALCVCVCARAYGTVNVRVCV